MISPKRFGDGVATTKKEWLEIAAINFRYANESVKAGKARRAEHFFQKAYRAVETAEKMR